jgi:hypothetical protein
MPGDVYRIGMPRTDLNVTVKAVPVKAGFALGSYAAFTDGMYYVVRANALDDNFRLYYYDRGRRQPRTSTAIPRGRTAPPPSPT